MFPGYKLRIYSVRGTLVCHYKEFIDFKGLSRSIRIFFY